MFTRRATTEKVHHLSHWDQVTPFVMGLIMGAMLVAWIVHCHH